MASELFLGWGLPDHANSGQDTLFPDAPYTHWSLFLRWCLSGIDFIVDHGLQTEYTANGSDG
ncbi:MAG: hypothetical protein ACRDH5_12770 [bacterium]